MGSAIMGALATAGEYVAAGASAAGEGLAAGASAVGEGIATGASAVGEGVAAAPEMVADALQWTTGKVADAAQWTGEGAKDMLSQAWQNVKENNIEPLIARDESGAIDGWKTAGNVAYAIPGGLAAAKGFGGGEQTQTVSAPDMSTPPDTTGGQAQTEDAEMLLNVLRSKTEG